MQTSDPKLKEAMSEITAICRKHNIGGHIILCSEKFAEFKYFMNEPTWSCIMFAEDGAVRFRSKKEDWPDKATQDAATEATVNMVGSIKDLTGRCFLTLDGLMKELHDKMEITTDPVLTPHREN